MCSSTSDGCNKCTLPNSTWMGRGKSINTNGHTSETTGRSTINDVGHGINGVCSGKYFDRNIRYHGSNNHGARTTTTTTSTTGTAAPGAGVKMRITDTGRSFRSIPTRRMIGNKNTEEFKVVTTI